MLDADWSSFLVLTINGTAIDTDLKRGGNRAAIGTSDGLAYRLGLFGVNLLGSDQRSDDIFRRHCSYCVCGRRFCKFSVFSVMSYLTVKSVILHSFRDCTFLVSDTNILLFLWRFGIANPWNRFKVGDRMQLENRWFPSSCGARKFFKVKQLFWEAESIPFVGTKHLFREAESTNTWRYLFPESYLTYDLASH